MNIKNVMRDILNLSIKRDSTAVTFAVDKDEENFKMNFFVLRNIPGEKPGKLNDKVIYFHLDYSPRLNENMEWSLYLDGFKPIQFNKKYLGRMLKQCFPEAKEKQVNSWVKTFQEYCDSELKDAIAIIKEERESRLSS